MENIFNPLVSICVTTYNRKELLRKTIDSILNQTYKNFEIIIVDDYSSDGTEEYINNEILNLDSRIIYIKHEINKGLACGRNTAINASQGKYFTFCDDDDTWKINFLETIITSFEELDNSYSVCASSISDDSSVKAMESTFKGFIMNGYTPPVASQFYLTQTLKDCGAYDEQIKSGVDHDLWLTLGKNDFKLLWINQNMVSINSIKTTSRMTYNADKRINGIKSSMSIWKQRVGNSFGKNFFDCFEKNYRYNTYKKFILYSIKNKKYLESFKYFFNLPLSLFFLDLKRYILRKLQMNNILSHPAFERCMKKNNLIKIIKK